MAKNVIDLEYIPEQVMLTAIADNSNCGFHVFALWLSRSHPVVEIGGGAKPPKLPDSLIRAVHGFHNIRYEENDFFRVPYELEIFPSIHAKFQLI